MTTIETQSERASFGGETGFYGRPYETCDGEPRFAVYTPPGVAGGPVPVLYCLDGLTYTEGTLMIKGGAQRLAAEHGLMLVAPATGPRTADVPGEDGFYVDATEGPWSRHHRMYSYVTLELPSVVEENPASTPAASSATPWAATARSSAP